MLGNWTCWWVSLTVWQGLAWLMELELAALGRLSSALELPAPCACAQAQERALVDPAGSCLVWIYSSWQTWVTCHFLTALPVGLKNCKECDVVYVLLKLRSWFSLSMLRYCFFFCISETDSESSGSLTISHFPKQKPHGKWGFVNDAEVK